MKILIFLVLLCTLFSCQKEQLQTQTNEDTLSIQSIKEPVEVVDIQPYDSRIYNECAREYVHITGSLTYRTQESRTRDVYYLKYEIDFDNVSGVGETTGLIYSGGGSDISVTKNSLRSKAVYSTQTYDVSYYTPNKEHALIFKQNAQYVTNAFGKVLVNYNHIGDTCR